MFIDPPERTSSVFGEQHSAKHMVKALVSFERHVQQNQDAASIIARVRASSEP